GENISKIKAGQKVVIRKEYYSTNSIPGKIEEISMISESSESGGKDYFKVRVRLARISEDDLGVSINKAVYGEIILEEKTDVVSLPFDAVRYEEDGSPYLFLYKDGRAKKQGISIGLKSEECVEVIKGLDLQDRIISQGILELSDGQKVSLSAE
ncbi:MAG: hypothetical protein QME81_07170, partial [bacterium]|nr:hypothetical protein [bacterium]